MGHSAEKIVQRLLRTPWPPARLGVPWSIGRSSQGGHGPFSPYSAAVGGWRSPKPTHGLQWVREAHRSPRNRHSAKAPPAPPTCSTAPPPWLRGSPAQPQPARHQPKPRSSGVEHIVPLLPSPPPPPLPRAPRPPSP